MYVVLTALQTPQQSTDRLLSLYIYSVLYTQPDFPGFPKRVLHLVFIVGDCFHGFP